MPRAAAAKVQTRRHDRSGISNLPLLASLQESAAQTSLSHSRRHIQLQLCTIVALGCLSSDNMSRNIPTVRFLEALGPYPSSLNLRINGRIMNVEECINKGIQDWRILITGAAISKM
jgi:hypothetical protein